MTFLIGFHDYPNLYETDNRGIRCVNFALINVFYNLKRLLLYRFFVVWRNNSPIVPYIQELIGSDVAQSLFIYYPRYI